MMFNNVCSTHNHLDGLQRIPQRRVRHTHTHTHTHIHVHTHIHSACCFIQLVSAAGSNAGAPEDIDIHKEYYTCQNRLVKDV